MRRHMDVPQDALRKAAVVVACLDDELAQRLLGRLSPGQSALLRRVLRGLGPVSDRERDATIVEFFRVRPMHSVDAAGGVELDQSLAQRLGEVSHTETRNEFDFLANTNPQQLTELLQNAVDHGFPEGSGGGEVAYLTRVFNDMVSQTSARCINSEFERARQEFPVQSPVMR